jgi:hypothetical protein
VAFGTGGGAATSPADWLVAPDNGHAVSSVSEGPTTPGAAHVTLDNGLLKRAFTLNPGWGTVELAGADGDSALRTILPEASLSIEGTQFFLGGLYLADDPNEPTGSTYTGQHAFLNRSTLAARLAVRPGSWRHAEHWVAAPEPTLPWTPGRRSSPKDAEWPPRGRRLSVRFSPPPGRELALGHLNITLVYELYDGAPLMSKWVEISLMTGFGDATPPPMMVEALSPEVLGVNCEFSNYGGYGRG